MDSLDLKVPKEDLESHLHNIRHISAMDKKTPIRRSKKNNTSKETQSITASSIDLQGGVRAQ